MNFPKQSKTWKKPIIKLKPEVSFCTILFFYSHHVRPIQSSWCNTSRMSRLWIADASPGVATWCAVFFRDSWCALKSPFIFTTSKTWSCSRPFSTLHPTPQVREEIVKESASVRCDKLWILVNTQFICLLLPKERRFNCKNSVGHTNTTLTRYFLRDFIFTLQVSVLFLPTIPTHTWRTLAVPPLGRS